MQKHDLSPLAAIRSAWTNRALIIGLAKREIFGRYKGSVLGVLWSFLTPLIMLLVYTFVFSVVFKAKWNTESSNKAEFAIVLFSGLIFYNFFAEVTNKSPSLVISSANYVKKVVFPLETLAFINVMASLFHLCISIFVWLLAYVVLIGIPALSMIYLPLVVFPLVLICLGLTWFLAGISVYLRDVNHIVAVTTTVLLFLSPIFYPVEILPPTFQLALHINPLTFIIEQGRAVMIWGESPDWTSLASATMLAALFAYIGFAWFQTVRKGFSDVL